ncbi:MAG: putative DNA binding domain-containing protein [Synergistota bacterium]|jgi:ATP-dependent DNA helicase RecG|nr:putative DNA binding domain-containing protein [Synergistota bacterium]
MEIVDILQVLTQGEDSKNQFKKKIVNADSLAHELVAFSNSLGGKLFLGVDDDGEIVGLEQKDIQSFNQLLSNTASQNVRPSINPLTEIFTIDGKHILVVNVPKGNNKPYQDKNGVIWVKNGADKRKATSREEIQRLFQQSGMIHADVTLVDGVTVADLDMSYFKDFFQKRYGKSLEDQEVPLDQLITNLNLGKDGLLNITGTLLFSSFPEMHLPAYIVKAAVFPGTSVATEEYIDSRDISGKMSNIFQKTINFILENVKHIQGEQGINSIGKPEVPRVVLEELVANALVHRDYFISAPVRVFVFSDRIEIISPGHLPNNLTVENIKAGNSNTRNPVLASFAYQILPYRGFGSGIIRALAQYPDIEFIDDRDGNVFKCIILRR